MTKNGLNCKLNETADKKLTEFFESQVKKSGHSLENKVENIFRKFFAVDREVPYLDRDESKGRNIDLVASAAIPDVKGSDKKGKFVLGQIILVIECKSLANYGWVFFERDTPALVFPDKVSIADPVSTEVVGNDPTRNYTPVRPIEHLFCASGRAQFISDGKSTSCEKQSGARNKDYLYEAINVVTKATRYQIEKWQDLICKKMLYLAGQLENIIAFAVVQPLIVFEGHMYGSTLMGQETQLQSIKFAQIEKRYVSANYDEKQGMIHVVSYAALPEYLNLIRKYYWARSDRMLRDQESLLSSTHMIIDYLQRRISLHRTSCKGRFRKMIEYSTGKPSDSAVGETSNSIIYLYRNKIHKKSMRANRNLVSQTEFDYCFICGRQNMVGATKYCCTSFSTTVSNGAIEIITDNNGQEKFVINLITRDTYDNLLSSPHANVVEPAGLRCCPFCGVILHISHALLTAAHLYPLAFFAILKPVKAIDRKYIINLAPLRFG